MVSVLLLKTRLDVVSLTVREIPLQTSGQDHTGYDGSIPSCTLLRIPANLTKNNMSYAFVAFHSHFFLILYTLVCIRWGDLQKNTRMVCDDGCIPSLVYHNTL